MPLGCLAQLLGSTVPCSLLHAKGWVGQLVEVYLGATASNLPLPDFPELGIELKTLPVNEAHQSMESTFVCRATYPIFESSFEESRVWCKLKRVLWVPVEGSKEIPISERRIGQPFLWSPDAQTKDILSSDWSDLTKALTLGCTQEILANHGEYLQLRPKALNSKVVSPQWTDEGQRMPQAPRGFYLRSRLTRQILKNVF